MFCTGFLYYFIPIMQRNESWYACGKMEEHVSHQCRHSHEPSISPEAYQLLIFLQLCHTDIKSSGFTMKLNFAFEWKDKIHFEPKRDRSNLSLLWYVRYRCKTEVNRVHPLFWSWQSRRKISLPKVRGFFHFLNRTYSLTGRAIFFQSNVCRASTRLGLSNKPIFNHVQLFL